MPAAHRACETCSFYAATGSRQGQCRRHPPPWPTTYAEDWCGDYAYHDDTPPDDTTIAF